MSYIIGSGTFSDTNFIGHKGQAVFTSTPSTYPTLAAAQAEAERLALLNPDTSYIIFQAVETFTAKTHTEMHRESLLVPKCQFGGCKEQATHQTDTANSIIGAPLLLICDTHLGVWPNRAWKPLP